MTAHPRSGTPDTRGISPATLRAFKAKKRGKIWRFTGYPVDSNGTIRLDKPGAEIHNPAGQPSVVFEMPHPNARYRYDTKTPAYETEHPEPLLFLKRPLVVKGDLMITSGAWNAMSLNEWIMSEKLNAVAIGISGINGFTNERIAKAMNRINPPGQVTIFAKNDTTGAPRLRVRETQSWPSGQSHHGDANGFHTTNGRKTAP